MKKSLFYCIAIALVIGIYFCLFTGVSHGQPKEFVGILVALLAITDLIFVIEQGWGLGMFIWLLVLTGTVTFVMGVFNLLANVPFPLPLTESFDPIYSPVFWVSGIRWVSIIWPTAVLLIGISTYYDREKSQKEKAKQEIPEKEESELA